MALSDGLAAAIADFAVRAADASSTQE